MAYRTPSSRSWLLRFSIFSPGIFVSLSRTLPIAALCTPFCYPGSLRHFVGDTAQFTRPIGMGTTYQRSLCAVAHDSVTTHWQDALSPVQVLTGHNKEAHAAFARVQDALDSFRSRMSGVLLTDLMKAFEWVHPAWLLHILRVRGAPSWFRRLVAAITGKRRTSTKIQRFITSTVTLYLGLDMGNALSPWLFCLALDPLLC